VEIIVGAGPGGGNDRLARGIQHVIDTNKLVAAKTVVLNKPGAGGTVALHYLNDHAGDGNYIMVTNPALITNPLVELGDVTYKDVTPLVQLLGDYVVLVGNTKLQYATGKDVVKALKANPKSLRIGVSPGFGTGVHLAVAQVVQTAGIDPKELHIIPYSTGSEALASLLGGEIDLLPTTTQNVQEVIAAGKVKAYGISSPKRLAGSMASVPTWIEQGFDVTYNNWRAVIGPKDLPPEAVAYWEGVFEKVDHTAEWQKFAEQNYVVNDFHKSAEFAAFLQKDNAATEAILDKLGLLKK
jgi:putative tricarboxylic transport membrane protein